MSNETTMVSRSLRIKPETLRTLEKQAKETGLGITVFIRQILENHVSDTERHEDLFAMQIGGLGGTL